MRTRRYVVTTVIATFLGVAPAAAQFVAPLHIIPVIVKARGAAGTDGKSDLAITNLASHQVTVGAQFFREAHDNTFNGSFSKSFAMSAGETTIVTDVLGSWFPSQGNSKGMLMITSQGSDTDRLAVTSRAYNAADPSATYGAECGTTPVDSCGGTGLGMATSMRDELLTSQPSPVVPGVR